MEVHYRKAGVQGDDRCSLAALRGGGFLVGYAMCILPCCVIEDPVPAGSVTDRGCCSSSFWPPHSTLVRFPFINVQRGVDRFVF